MWVPQLQPMTFQEEAIEFGIRNPYSIYALDMGLGKAQPLYSKIVTPTGFKTMGEIEVGDFVIGKDGKKKKVLGVFPQGIKKVYEVTFQDGSRTHCCDEHLWEIRSPLQESRGKDFLVKSLKDFKNNLKDKNKNRLVKIPITKPVEYEPIEDILIPPYLMGLLIGDGSLTNPQAIKITNASEHIYQKVLKEALILDLDVRRHLDTQGNTYNISLVRKSLLKRNPLVAEIISLGLNKTSHYKFVPDKYKYGNINCRRGVLSGLLDTDGYVASDGCVQFSSSSKRLVMDVREITQSLGGVSTAPKHKITNFNTDAWTITLKIPSDMDIVTKPSKKERMRSEIKYAPSRLVDSVEYVGEFECQCISVEGGLYLTDEYIVTHNTYCSIVRAVRTAKAPHLIKHLIVCPSYLKINWKNEILKIYPEANVSIIDHGRDFYVPWDSQFIIISYSFLPSAQPLFQWARVVDFDEAHYLKNMAAIRSDAAHRLVFENEIERVGLLTGTPIENRVYEFYSLIALCNYDPRITESKFLKRFPTYVDFANHFSYLEEYTIYIKGRKQTKFRWDGYRNVEELKEYTKNCMIRMKSDDVLDLPEELEIPVQVSYADNPELLAEFERYTETSDDSIAGLEAKAKVALATAPFTAEYVKNLLDQCAQVVVYSDHVASAEYIAEKLGVRAIHGQTPMDVRQKMADEFTAGESKVIVATIGAFSTGITLITANNMVFNDLPFSPSKLRQAMYRIRRIGQTRRCIFHMIYGSIQSEKISKMLKTKMKTIEAVL